MMEESKDKESNHDLSDLPENEYYNPDSTIRGWNKDTTDYFREYAWKAAGLSWMHGEDASFYHSRNTKISLMISVCSVMSAITIAASIIFVGDDSCETDKQIGYYIFAGIGISINFLMALLSAYKMVMNFDRKIGDHSELSAKFGKLFRKIKCQFSRNPEDRIDALEFSDYLQDRFDELDREKPFLRNKTINNWGSYQRKIKSSPIDSDYDSIIKMPIEFRRNSWPITKDKLPTKKNANMRTKKTINDWIEHVV